MAKTGSGKTNKQDHLLHDLNSYLEAFDEAGILVRCLNPERPANPASPANLGSTLVRGISYDSRQVEPDWLFVCKGLHFEERYLFAAINQGAAAIVYESAFLSEELLAQCAQAAPVAIEVSNLRAALPIIANLFHDRVWERITTVGITGTKGKSTTTYYLKSILDAWADSEGHPHPAILSSIDAYDGVEDHESHITTPEIFELYQHLANAVASGIQHLVMEVSSQGLKYGRTAGVVYDIGCFLNIGEDHISTIEHTDAEDYFQSKLLLFKQCSAAVINAASDKVERILEAAQATLPADNITTYSAVAGVEASLEASQIESIHTAELNGLGFTVSDRGLASSDRFVLGMTGIFNVENALAAIALARLLEVPEKHIHAGLRSAGVPGRMELFRASNGAVIIIDYAHNWMSFERLFASVEAEYPGTRRTILFGCPGYKALGRRWELGTLAGRFCAMTYLTEEDAGEEPVDQICQEIATHVAAAGGAYEIILDREEAIRIALDDALADTSGKTVVMLTGKGRETRQKRGLEYIPVLSDLEIVLAWLNSHKNKELY